MKIDEVYFNRLLEGEVEGPISDLGQLANFWGVRARISEHGDLEGLSPTEAKVSLLLVYVGEVLNGGHVQYLLNPSGCLAHEAIAALSELGEAGAASALSAAAAMFPAGLVPKDRIARDAAVQELSDGRLSQLDELDRQVGALSYGVHERALAFLKHHRGDVLRSERSLR